MGYTFPNRITECLPPAEPWARAYRVQSPVRLLSLLAFSMPPEYQSIHNAVTTLSAYRAGELPPRLDTYFRRIADEVSRKRLPVAVRLSQPYKAAILALALAEVQDWYRRGWSGSAET